MYHYHYQSSYLICYIKYGVEEPFPYKVMPKIFILMHINSVVSLVNGKSPNEMNIGNIF